MARGRMFSISFIHGDTFTTLPHSAQALYFQLLSVADDDGFFKDRNATCIRMIGCSPADFSLLCQKGLVYVFDSGVTVIMHWRAQNQIRSDRYKPTVYQRERDMLQLDESGVYLLPPALSSQNGATPCAPENPKEGTDSAPASEAQRAGPPLPRGSQREKIDYQIIIDRFNSICPSLPRVRSITDKRKKAIQTAYRDLKTVSGFEDLFRKAEKSDFLSGRSGKWSGCGFDWILKPANMVKILEDTYCNREPTATGQGEYQTWMDKLASVDLSD